MYFSFPPQPSPLLGYTFLSLSFALSLSVSPSLSISHTQSHTDVHLGCGDWLSLQDCLVYFWSFWNLISVSSTGSVSSHVCMHAHTQTLTRGGGRSFVKASKKCWGFFGIIFQVVFTNDLIKGSLAKQEQKNLEIIVPTFMHYYRNNTFYLSCDIKMFIVMCTVKTAV